MATSKEQEAWQNYPESRRYVVTVILLAYGDLPMEVVPTESNIEDFLKPLLERHEDAGVTISSSDLEQGYYDGSYVGFMVTPRPQMLGLTDAGVEYLKKLQRRFQVGRMRVDVNKVSPTEYDSALQAMINANPGREIYARVNNITMETQFLVKYASKEIEPNE